jgi:hypothetical protein
LGEFNLYGIGFCGLKLVEQKKLLKQLIIELLSLPQNAPDSAIYLLTGFLPVEAQIHIKALQLFNNITNRIGVI